MLQRCPYVVLYSIHHLGERMLFLAQECGLRNSHILAIARGSPEVFTRQQTGARQA